MRTRDTYRSISGESKAVYRDKASKFIAVAMPVSSEEEVKEVLDKTRKEYYDANHHCFAFRIGMEGERFRMNDDGEPAGSAGRPIYGQLLSMDVSDVLIVVIRYFGGTKLGVPGLIHAYKTVSREALDKATIIMRMVTEACEIKFPYQKINEVMKVLKDEGISIEDQVFDEPCRVRFRVRLSKADSVRGRLTNINNLSIFMHT